MLAAYLTNEAAIVLNKLMASMGPLEFTRAELGDGLVSSEEEARARTTLINKVVDAVFSGSRWGGGEAVLSIQYTNTYLELGFFVREIALYCKDPDDAGREVLYCYATFGDQPDWIASRSAASYTRTYDIATIIASISEITVNISPSVMVSREDFLSAISLLNQEDARLSAEIARIDSKTASDIYTKNGTTIQEELDMFTAIPAWLGNSYLSNMYLSVDIVDI
jgi:hypothetical protein